MQANPFVGEGKGHPEHTLQVLLQGYLAARQLLFRDVDLAALPAVPPGTADSPADLYRYLFDEATSKMKLREDTLWKDRLYARLPLVRRITDIVHQLRPDLCFNIPLTIDRTRPVWLHIPYGIAHTDTLQKELLATFVLTSVLNRAMGAGLSYAEVDLQNLAILPGTEAARQQGPHLPSTLMGPDDWRNLIVEIYRRGGYEVLLGRYLRDYNTQKHNVYFEKRLTADLGPTSDNAHLLPLGSVHDELVRYVAALSGRNSAESRDVHLVGVDIGGTLTKCQIFSYIPSNGRFRAGSVFRMSTAPPSGTPRTQSGDSIRSRTEDFANRLLKLIESRAGRELRASKKPVVIIGLSWPGPVRDNRIAGTSGCLKNFGPFSSAIVENKIDEIWEVDIADAMAKAWARDFDSAPEFVSLLNDGDADAVGTVFGSTFTDGELQSVVKLGTGLAGALLSCKASALSLVPGLFEWGKFVLDVAAPMGRGFPTGVASTYLSKKCLPKLAALRGADSGCFQRDDPDSAEIGLILQTYNSADPLSDFQMLRSECGAIQAERFPPWGVPVSAEVLRVVYRDQYSDPELLLQVRLALRAWDVKKQLRKNIEQYGLIRIAQLIQAEPPTGTDKDQLKASLTNAAGIAAACAETLGRYMGDFCVLLYDQLGISALRLTGGVLTGDTGMIAKMSAVARVKSYGLQLSLSLDGSFYHLTTSEYDRSEDLDRRTLATVSPNVDAAAGVERGALGAAWFAAASLVNTRKQEGYQRLRALLLSLTAGEEVYVQDTSIVAPSRTIEFAGYVLSKGELRAFLQTHGPEWGFYQSEENDRYVRWVQ